MFGLNEMMLFSYIFFMYYPGINNQKGWLEICLIQNNLLHCFVCSKLHEHNVVSGERKPFCQESEDKWREKHLAVLTGGGGGWCDKYNVNVTNWTDDQPALNCSVHHLDCKKTTREKKWKMLLELSGNIHSPCPEPVYPAPCLTSGLKLFKMQWICISLYHLSWGHKTSSSS